MGRLNAQVIPGEDLRDDAAEARCHRSPGMQWGESCLSKQRCLLVSGQAARGVSLLVPQEMSAGSWIPAGKGISRLQLLRRNRRRRRRLIPDP